MLAVDRRPCLREPSGVFEMMRKMRDESDGGLMRKVFQFENLPIKQ